MDSRPSGSSHEPVSMGLPRLDEHDRFSACGDEQPAPLSGFSRRVLSLIGEGSADQPAIAHVLGMSVATLRRRLTDEGTSFRMLRSQALTEKAHTFLRSDLPMAQIAERLGFSDVRSFSRAFKAWTGETPNAVRKRFNS